MTDRSYRRGPRAGGGEIVERAARHRLRRLRTGRPRVRLRGRCMASAGTGSTRSRDPARGERGGDAAARAPQPHRLARGARAAGQGRPDPRSRTRRPTPPGASRRGAPRSPSTRRQRRGYRGVIAATSGNYGAAVASQAAMRGLACIVLQEVFDSAGRGQPEILEKGRACEAYGAEVWQLTVGPELFYVMLLLLEETGYFSASLYTPHAVAGIETLGWEIGAEVSERYGREPDAVVVTHAGGRQRDGHRARPRDAGCDAHAGRRRQRRPPRAARWTPTRDFNRKSFTTGHTGFGVPVSRQPGPGRRAAQRGSGAALPRPLRHGHSGRGLLPDRGACPARGARARSRPGTRRSRGPSCSPRSSPRDAVVVVQETEYTGAGKHPTAQLTFARELGVEIRRGHPSENVPGQGDRDPALARRARGRRTSTSTRSGAPTCGGRSARRRPADLADLDLDFLAEEVRSRRDTVRGWLDEAERAGVEIGAP